MKAWEFEHKLTADAVPPDFTTTMRRTGWPTRKPAAPPTNSFSTTGTIRFRIQSACDVVIAAVQSMHNRGYDVTEAEIHGGLKASEEKDGAAIQVATAKIFH